MTASSTLQSAHRTKFQRTFALSGCRPFPLSAAEMADYDGRYEYWEAGIAWELRDVSPKHERPSARLAELVGDIAKMRGRPIEMFGTADLQEHGASGARIRAAQADELVYLDYHYDVPDVFVVGELPLPDVVFEVDLTTDIRDRKLDVYAAWGVRELWVEVPDAEARSKRKRPGLTIHLLHGSTFQESVESVAFPTLSAREIHTALNEPVLSVATVAALTWDSRPSQPPLPILNITTWCCCTTMSPTPTRTFRFPACLPGVPTPHSARRARPSVS